MVWYGEVCYGSSGIELYGMMWERVECYTIPRVYAYGRVWYGMARFSCSLGACWGVLYPLVVLE